MKTSTVVVIGLAAAAGLFAIVKLRPATTATKPTTVAQPKTSREAFERSAIDLGTKLGGKLIDSYFGATSREPIGSSGSGTVTV